MIWNFSIIQQKHALTCPGLYRLIFQSLYHNTSLSLQFFNPLKLPWNWIAFYQKFFVISHSSLYHPIRRDSGRLTNKTFMSNHIVSAKQYLSSFKITNSFVLPKREIDEIINFQKFRKLSINKFAAFLKHFGIPLPSGKSKARWQSTWSMLQCMAVEFTLHCHWVSSCT